MQIYEGRKLGVQYLADFGIMPIGLFIFHCDILYSTVIDFIATHDSFRRIGLARYMLHIVQKIAANTVNSVTLNLYTEQRNEDR